ncbi:MAG: tryptophan--tRNA ligase [candidate division WOR-3 bacterium]|nr:tryptophan--tRNA ligase [candidate division WOR-3 bacterium]MCX7947129.1 tryptophan--tRNA ligase [candidate division WOR-3 bacterium]MDW8149830.1 tryptophan--tRNA ligase [candidate division WOR-3 bacterium]
MIVLSGMRPTGKLHIGHLVGVLENWKHLQDKYRCYFFIADFHALTENPKNAFEIVQNTLEVVKDWISVGIDYKKSVIFVQSKVMEHAQLHLILSMLVSLNRLFRNPTYKEKVEELARRGIESKLVLNVDENRIEESINSTLDFIFKTIEIENDKSKSREQIYRKLKSDIMELLRTTLDSSIIIEQFLPNAEISYGFLGYPVLQSADILIYRANFVPIGQDQIPHLELARELARRFNSLYSEVFPIPEPILTEFPKVLGIDGRKMSKSYNNAIYISDSSNTVKEKIRKYFTDPNKIRKNDPGRPDICPIFYLHRVFNKEEKEEIYIDCSKGKLGCVDCKMKLFKKLDSYLEPIRQRREEVSSKEIFDILNDGFIEAQKRAQQTLELAYKAMKFQ